MRGSVNPGATEEKGVKGNPLIYGGQRDHLMRQKTHCTGITRLVSTLTGLDSVALPTYYIKNICSLVESNPVRLETSGQSYEASMIVIYNSRVVLNLKIPHITTIDS